MKKASAEGECISAPDGVPLCAQVIKLMDTDLLNEADKWADTLKKMRDKFYHLEHGFGFKHLEQWKLHWDYQLYKALEHQYQMVCLLCCRDRT